jgi:hypothetical protein
MYCRHKPTDCKEQDKDKEQKTSSAPAASSDGNNKKPLEPKLKLNKDLATALAA